MPKPKSRRSERSTPLNHGDVLSFRIPKNLSEEELAYLNKIKSNDSKMLSALFFDKIQEMVNHTPKITIPLPSDLSLEQYQALKDENAQKVLFQIVQQFVSSSSEDRTVEQPFNARTPLIQNNFLNNLKSGLYND
ncbi:hypothetical protein ACOJUR_15850 [Alicyclobacillus tolerans]|uniref:hypothetical protein n=1 Tax=Alicyclobacillus tolerans TaxID=90970 RepID=UPI003B786238